MEAIRTVAEAGGYFLSIWRNAFSKNTVLFFPDQRDPCLFTIYYLLGTNLTNCRYIKNKTCTYGHGVEGEPPCALLEFVGHLALAKRSVDLCVFTFTHKILADVLIHLHERKGVKVRIVTDNSEKEIAKSQLANLQAKGIGIKSKDQLNNELMHNKFVVIDGETLLFGSANWTRSAFRQNKEAIVVTDNHDIVKPFTIEFERMWSDYQRHPDSAV